MITKTRYPGFLSRLIVRWVELWLEISGDPDKMSPMSTLSEIEEAIVRLPSPQVEELALWLERRRSKPPEVPEPDFLARAKAVWGDNPEGKPLSKLISEGRG